MNAPAPVIRYGITQRDADGTGRVLAHPAQGGYTYATHDEAAAQLAAMMANNSPATLAQAYRLPLQVQAVECYPGHHDPMRTYWADGRSFGVWCLESVERSPARLLDPSGDCAAMVYLTDSNRKRTPASLDRAARIVAALNASL